MTNKTLTKIAKGLISLTIPFILENTLNSCNNKKENKQEIAVVQSSAKLSQSFEEVFNKGNKIPQDSIIAYPEYIKNDTFRTDGIFLIDNHGKANFLEEYIKDSFSKYSGKIPASSWFYINKFFPYQVKKEEFDRGFSAMTISEFLMKGFNAKQVNSFDKRFIDLSGNWDYILRFLERGFNAKQVNSFDKRFDGNDIWYFLGKGYSAKSVNPFNINDRDEIGLFLSKDYTADKVNPIVKLFKKYNRSCEPYFSSRDNFVLPSSLIIPLLDKNFSLNEIENGLREKYFREHL